MNWKKLGITNIQHFFFGFVCSVIRLCNVSPIDKEIGIEHGEGWYSNVYPDEITQELSLFFVEDIQLSKEIYIDSFKGSFPLVLRDENKGYLLAQQLKEKWFEKYKEIFSLFENDCKMFPARFSWRLRMKKAIKKTERFIDSLNKEQKLEIKKFLLSFIDIKEEQKDLFLRRFWPGCEFFQLCDHDSVLQYMQSYYEVWRDGRLESGAEHLFRWKRNWEDGQGVFDF